MSAFETATKFGATEEQFRTVLGFSLSNVYNVGDAWTDASVLSELTRIYPSGAFRLPTSEPPPKAKK